MAIEYGRGKTTSSAKLKVAMAAATGLAVTVIVGTMFSWRLAPLLGWDMAALLYVLWTWIDTWPMNSSLTAAHAVREDPTTAASDIIVLAASVASLVAVGIVLVGASTTGGAAKVAQIALGVLSVVIAWIVVHTLFALHYAELYYHGRPGGVQFPGTPQPTYKDFAYLAFTVGMTFQVSDTGFQTTEFRQTALHHSLISYLFGTVIVASTINLIAGLTG